MQSLFRGNVSHSVYTAEPDLRVILHNGKKIVVNPNIGGWAVVKDRELAALLHPNSELPLEPDLGKQAFVSGLARKDGCPIYVHQVPSQMHLFEFNVTAGCNLHCVYCYGDYAKQGFDFKALPNLAEALIDRIVEYRLTCNDGLILEFSGGEPMANFEVIHHAMQYADHTYANKIKFLYSIQTNLTLLSERQINLLKQYNVTLTVSIDGIKSVHDRQRPYPDGRGSYDTVIKNLKRLRKGGIPVNKAICVITADSVRLMPLLAENLIKVGINNFIFAPVFQEGRSKEEQGLAPAPEEYGEYSFKTFEQVLAPYFRRTGQVYTEIYLALIFSTLMQPRRSFMCHRSPCGAGLNMCSVKYNGDVFPCGRLLPYEEFKMGNIYDHSIELLANSEVAVQLRERNIERIGPCRNCMYRGWCLSACAQSAYIMTIGYFKI